MNEIKANYTKFGLKVKQELAKKRLTQSWLAKEMGVSDAFLTHILQGMSCPDVRMQQIKELVFDDKNRGAKAFKTNS